MSRRQALRITAVAGVSVALGGALVSELARQLGLHRVSETRTRMGTVVTITVVHPDAGASRSMVSAAFDEMACLEALLSRHRPDTPVSRLNQEGVVLDAPPELLRVLAAAERYAQVADGAFDVTVAPLLELYARSFAEGRTPSESEVDEARARVGHHLLRVEGSTVSFERPGMSITLDGIAKGYVVDRTVEVLTGRGADRVLVNAGGDMASAGVRSVEEPWRVSVQDPDDERRFVDVLRLAGDCIATSGDYMRAFTQDRRFHHIVDPRTGYSPPEASSVTVLAKTALEADALSTTGLVLGPERALALFETLEGVEAVVVTKSRARMATSGLARHTAA